jgi:hypothetical protein
VLGRSWQVFAHDLSFFHTETAFVPASGNYACSAEVKAMPSITRRIVAATALMVATAFVSDMTIHRGAAADMTIHRGASVAAMTIHRGTALAAMTIHRGTALAELTIHRGAATV